MCLVIVDVNCLSDVFKRNTKNHKEFEPVFKGIDRGDFKMVFGGEKYTNELLKFSKLLPIINTLKKVHKIISVSDEEVDEEQKKIESNVRDPDFDDPHLPAIAIISKCHIICTKDERFVAVAKKFRKIIFPKGFCIKFYTQKKNANLLKPHYLKKLYS